MPAFRFMHIYSGLRLRLLRLRLTVYLLLFVLLLVFAQLLGEQLFELLILKLLFRLHKLGLVPHWRVRHERGTACEQSDGEMECSNKRARRGVAKKVLSAFELLSI